MVYYCIIVERFAIGNFERSRQTPDKAEVPRPTAFEVVRQSELFRIATLREHSTDYQTVLETAGQLNDTMRRVSEQLATILPVTDITPWNRDNKKPFIASMYGQGFTLQCARPARMLYDTLDKHAYHKEEWIFVMPTEDGILRVNYTERAPLYNPSDQNRQNDLLVTKFTPADQGAPITPSTFLRPQRIMSCQRMPLIDYHMLRTPHSYHHKEGTPVYALTAHQGLSQAARDIYIGLNTLIEQS